MFVVICVGVNSGVSLRGLMRRTCHGVLVSVHLVSVRNAHEYLSNGTHLSTLGKSLAFISAKHQMYRMPENASNPYLEHAPRSAHDCATSASAPSPFGRGISCSVEDACAVEFRPHAGNTAGLGWETKRTDDTRNGDGERLRDGKLAMTNPARRKQALGRTRLWVVAA